MYSILRRTLMMAGLLMLAGCGAAAPASLSAPEVVQNSPLAAPVRELPHGVSPLETPAIFPPGDAPVVTGETPADLVQAIIVDASQRTGQDAAAFTVLRAEAVEWNDGSLGCPEPGMFYTQALVRGYQVVIEAEGRALDYRATENGSFRLCERP